MYAMYLLYITCVFRCITPELKSLALGIQTLVMRTLGTINIQIIHCYFYLLRQESIKHWLAIYYFAVFHILCLLCVNRIDVYFFWRWYSCSSVFWSSHWLNVFKMGNEELRGARSLSYVWLKYVQVCMCVCNYYVIVFISIKLWNLMLITSFNAHSDNLDIYYTKYKS